MKFILNLGVPVSIAELAELASSHTPVGLSEQVAERVAASRRKLEQFVSEGRVIYGVNTSMGGFVNWLVPTDLAGELQNNLINAVATNVGKNLDDVSVRAIMLARIFSLARGNSGISLQNLQTYIGIYNAGIVPCVPEKGSLGTSGDLGPLAAIALACTGQWKARYKGTEMDAAKALREAAVPPMKLTYKEGLALINGTSGMVGLSAMTLRDARHLFETYLTASALSLESLHGILKPFDPRVHRLKPHPGQQAVAEYIYGVLQSSTMIVSERAVETTIAVEQDGTVKPSSHHIEDAYSLRCSPQILGPVLDTLDYVSAIVERELNSSNDNPLILPDEDEVFHNGHFHGQYVAMAMDHLVVAMATISNLSNRRIDRFLDQSHSKGLPPFLCAENQGLRLGLMGGQFMSASVTAEIRSMAVPLSIQSLTSTADFQDIVSFGFVAARRARDVIENVRYVVAFELICACQAAEIRSLSGLSETTRRLFDRVRQNVPFLEADQVLTDYLEAVARKVLMP